MKKLLPLFMILFVLILTGCNKTGVKGTVLYGPTSAPIEGITVKAVPRLDTEEKTSFTKTTTTDKNGEYKITGLESSYSFFIIIYDDKMIEAGKNKNQTIVSYLTKDQTKIINKPIIVFDILPGIGCYVKRDNGKFEEIQEFKRLSTVQFSGTFRTLDDGGTIHGSIKNPNFYYTSEDEIKDFNPTK
ncbi:MAG: hypothetical protein IPM96_21755 [Ignavibacteria bacterium]|nr:hypothetical protein [Ignavibacteria bacterium]